MSTRSTVAHEFRFSLEAGVISRDEIVSWADEIMATEVYDDYIANICLSTNESTKQLESLLGLIAEDADEWNGMRRMLSRMHDALVKDPDRLHEFTRFLDMIWFRFDYTVPDDLSFIANIEDDYQLAKEGIFSSVRRVRKKLLKNLAKYKT